MVDLYGKVSSYMILDQLDQKYIFSFGAGRHFELGPLTEKCQDFHEVRGGYIFYKGCPEAKSIIKTSLPEDGHRTYVCNPTIAAILGVNVRHIGFLSGSIKKVKELT